MRTRLLRVILDATPKTGASVLFPKGTPNASLWMPRAQCCQREGREQTEKQIVIRNAQVVHSLRFPDLGPYVTWAPHMAKKKDWQTGETKKKKKAPSLSATFRVAAVV
jgi:hypothetical protein